MLFSMTGFGRSISETSEKKISVEIKSLNSKQMDLSVRLPQQYRDKESDLRNIVAHELQRGKVDMIVSVEPLAGNTGVEFNLPVMKSFKEQITRLSEELDIPLPSDWYSLLMRFPETLHAEKSEEVKEDEINTLFDTTRKAVELLMSHRRSEGKRLEDFFTERIDRISDLLGQVPVYEAERVEKIRARIQDNLSMLNSAEYDKGRFEQEMIFYIEKLDINEEKQRLAQHLRYFVETMHSQEGGQGKKLGFIAQEMGREINTLGSKSNHAELQKLVVMMKDELEQIKEQVLNVM